MNKTIKDLEKIENKLKKYEQLIEELIEFNDGLLQKLNSFGSVYLDDNKKLLINLEYKFEKIKENR